jgi:6-phosphogluconolactonase
MRIVVAREPIDGARTAAEFIAERLRQALARRGGATLAVSGGRAAGALLEALAERELAWDGVHLLQVDERIAPVDDEARNWRLVLRSPLAARLTADRMHPMPIELAGPALAAQRYAETLAAVAGDPPALDVVHLGLGADGHTASLFPGDALLSERALLVGVSGRHAGHRRLTLTLPALNRARALVWLVTGTEKAAALAGLRRGDRSLPAAHLDPTRATCFADEAAAASLPR